ncbi:2,3-diaminopropionate biosynthesis protein SbnB [Paenibacillus oenotherae]|uniref:2,3-diaminopropionate biosynthesis protein SbnB n=1 Tax=Paenibacillus oenotherae TaxID=1435645 RepID=A0ABS7D1J1_9BACL|nr:2,3-diaminopropionate biosynthesis protein SbnB [Paenibacillus oenotherae]MBW7473809.1 2,3-diaminopropionate biosynthesis protein SbnB [Paenibacillus oenotherae]
MLYLNEKHVKQLGVDWHETIEAIEGAVRCLDNGDYAQPVKPYLRFRDLKNRIIAMPAFVGGDTNSAGIKWIASFPGNIERNLPRASSVMILNDVDTGQPTAVINTSLLSVIRTASVTGMIMKHFMAARPKPSYKLGIIGFGPIGQYHLRMCQQLLGDRIASITLYDLRPIDLEAHGLQGDERITIAESWQQAYVDADIFITCTVSSKPYINEAPKPGALLLNVSLRDFVADAIYPHVKDAIIVDNWEEVCREKTDVEMMHLQMGLQEEGTRSIVDVIQNDCIAQFDPQAAVMFNPMGMASFDIAIGQFYSRLAKRNGVGQELE